MGEKPYVEAAVDEPMWLGFREGEWEAVQLCYGAPLDGERPVLVVEDTPETRRALEHVRANGRGL